MTSGLRFRIITLQAVLAIVLAFCAGFLFWAANFTHSQVQDQLAAQKVVFPPANSAAITALPKADAAVMNQYGGQNLTNGVQAEAYANHFIKIHLGEMGYTYSQISEKFLAMKPTDKNYAATAQLRSTIFMGTMLRGTLLQAYAWWTVGTYALYAAIGLLLATIAVAASLLFELFYAPSHVDAKDPTLTGRPTLASTAV
jgi:hypothetical protein